MSNLLHGANLSNQVLTQEKRLNRDKFNDASLWDFLWSMYVYNFLKVVLFSHRIVYLWGKSKSSLSDLETLCFGQIFSKDCQYICHICDIMNSACCISRLSCCPSPSHCRLQQGRSTDSNTSFFFWNLRLFVEGANLEAASYSSISSPESLLKIGLHSR